MSHVARAGASSVSGGTSGTSNVTPSADETLIALIAQTSTSSRTYTVFDDRGNVWTQAVAFTATNNRQMEIWYAPVSVASVLTAVTVQANANSTYQFDVWRHSGLVASSLVEATGTFDQTVSGTAHYSAASTDIDTLQGCDLIACLAGNGTFGTITPGSGYTALAALASQAAWQYKVASSPVTNDRGEITSSNSRTSGGVIVALRHAVAGGQPIIRRGLYLPGMHGRTRFISVG